MSQRTKPKTLNIGKCTKCSADARAAGKANNVLMTGDGMGIFYDKLESNQSRVYKVYFVIAN